MIPIPPQQIKASQRAKELTIIGDPNVRIRHWIADQDRIGRYEAEPCQGEACLLCKIGHQNSVTLEFPVRWHEKGRDGYIFLYERQLEKLAAMKDVVGVQIKFWRDGQFSNSPIEIEVLSA